MRIATTSNLDKREFSSSSPLLQSRRFLKKNSIFLYYKSSTAQCVNDNGILFQCPRLSYFVSTKKGWHFPNWSLSSKAGKQFPGRHQNGNYFFCTTALLTLGQLAGFAAFAARRKFAARTVAFPASLFGKLPPKCHVETKVLLIHNSTQLTKNVK